MTEHGKHALDPAAEPVDRRNPGSEFLQREIDENRTGEYRLIGVAVLALAVVAVLVVIREVFFA